jgi:hypothetical protein
LRDSQLPAQANDGSKLPLLTFVSLLNEVKGLQVAIVTVLHLQSYFVLEGHALYEHMNHGVVGPKDHNDILVRAERSLPHHYREPIGGVIVELEMLGTPVVTTDHAAMSESI